MRVFSLLLLMLFSHPQGRAVGPPVAGVSGQDLAIFGAVLRAGLIPPPDIGGPLTITIDMPSPPVVSRTLRVCAPGDPQDEVLCIPAGALYSITLNVSLQDVTLLKEQNAEGRLIPPDAILTVSPDQCVGAATWSSATSRRSKVLSDCACFSTPWYRSGEAGVYVNRVWKGNVHGWYVRLRGRGTAWRILSRKEVWRLYPGA